MTNNRNYYTTSSNYASTIPSRDEFHKYASNLITISDFETDHTNELQISKVDTALRWTIKNRKSN